MKENDIIVTIATPYLTENIAEEHGEEYAQKQIKEYGYQPDEVLKTTTLKAGKYNISLDTPENSLVKGAEDVTMTIAGVYSPTSPFGTSIAGGGVLTGNVVPEMSRTSLNSFVLS